jgi:hypothetical protein
MNHQYEEAKLSEEEIAEIYCKMKANGIDPRLLPGMFGRNETRTGAEEFHGAHYLPTGMMLI